MVRRKFWQIVKNDSPPPEPIQMYSVVMNDPVDDLVKQEKSRLASERDTLEMLKSSSVSLVSKKGSELARILEDDIKLWEQELPRQEAKIRDFTSRKDKPVEELAPVMLGKRKSTAQSKQIPQQAAVPETEEKRKEVNGAITMDHMLYYLKRSAKYNGTLIHQKAITLAARPN